MPEPGFERPGSGHMMPWGRTDKDYKTPRLGNWETQRLRDSEKIALCGIIGHRPLQSHYPIDFDSKLNQQMGHLIPLSADPVMLGQLFTNRTLKLAHGT